MRLIVDDLTSLELIDESHVSELNDLVQSNKDYLTTWLPWVENVNGVRFFERFISYSKERYANQFDLPLVITRDNALVGRIGLYDIDHHNRIANIGYWLGEDFQGKGVISSSCRRLISYAFESMDLNRIEIKCAVGNTPSQAIPQRLDFTREGIIRQGERHAHGFVDLILYSLLRDEWILQKAKS